MSGTNSNTTPPLDVRAEGRVRTTVGTVGKIVAGTITLTAAGVAAWTWAMADIRTLNSDTSTHEVQIKAIESRVKVLEASQVDLAVMKNDVQWIRRTLEQRERPRE